MRTGVEKDPVKVLCSQQKTVYLILQKKVDYVSVPVNQTGQNCIRNKIDTFFFTGTDRKSVV